MASSPESSAPTSRARTFLASKVVLLAVALLCATLATASSSGAGLIPPTTNVQLPARGSTVSGDVTVSGVAAHPVGVAGVRLVVKDLDEQKYWNGNEWQKGFVRIDVPAENPGAKNASWTFTLGAEHFNNGRYRARAFAYSVQGNGDSTGGDKHGFMYSDQAPATVNQEPAAAEPAQAVEVAPESPAPESPAPEPAPEPAAEPQEEVAAPEPAPVREAVSPTPAPEPAPAPAPEPEPAPAPEPEPARTFASPGCGHALALLEPCQGVLIGASGDYTDQWGNPKPLAEHFTEREQQMGAQFDVFHEFRQWNDLVAKDWPSSRTQQLADDGRRIFVNWKSPNGHPDDWSRIANGSLDADIRAAARNVADFGQPTLLAFFHEPEDNIKRAAGSDSAKAQRYVDDYRNAFRHIVSVFDAEGATNVAWVWDVQGYLPGYQSYYENGLYPGDDVVDWIGYNPYNWHGCDNHGDRRQWESFSETVSPFYNWLNEGGSNRPARDKPVILGEFGTEENDRATNSSQSKAEWIAEVGDVVPARFDRLKALIYFDTEGARTDGSITFCEWGLDSSPDALAAMGALLRDGRLANS